MVEISVVIPVYNVEDYLRECLDSIVNQTFKDMEIICINDGSTDKSLDILNEYAAKDNRFIVLSQENGGHAVATNRGMELAKGKYLYLMDSDDILKVETALEDTYKICEEKNLDFVIFQAINYYMDKNQYIKKENYSMNKLADFVGDRVFDWTDIKDYMFTISVTPWTKLYNREFIVNCGAKFPEGLVFEDNVFFWEVLFNAKRIYFYREHLFVRRWHSSSFTVSGGPQFKDSIQVLRLIWEVFKKYNIFHDFEKMLYHRRIDLGYMRFRLIRDEFKEQYLAEFKDSLNEMKQEENFENVFNNLSKRDKAIFRSVLESNSPKQLICAMNAFDSGKILKRPKDPIKVSIMMPVYNLENYIEKAVDSILEQFLENVELICVNDGSTDDSYEVLKSFAKKYNFIRLFTQENKGAGPALNRCIDEARGEYIAFLDADDMYIDKKALEKMYEIGVKNNADMVAANLQRTNLKGDLMGNFNYDVGNYAYFSKEDVISPREYGIPWAFYKNIYKRSFLNEHNIRFPPFKRGVDPVFLAKVLVNVSEIYTVPMDLYGYNYSIGGGFNNKLFDYDFKKNHLIAFKCVFDILSNAGFDDIVHKFKKELIFYLTNFGNENDLELFGLVHEVYGEDEHYFDDYYEEFMEYKVNLLLNNINDEESFDYAKRNLINTDAWNNDLLSKFTFREIFVILCSETFEECRLNQYKFKTKNNHLSLNLINDLVNDNTSILVKDKKELNNEVNTLIKTNNELNEKLEVFSKNDEINKNIFKQNNELKQVYKLNIINSKLKNKVKDLKDEKEKLLDSNALKISSTLRHFK